MALGATLKVKMDSTAVKRGLSNIRAGFVRLGGVVRGIGGAMRKAFIPAAAAAGALAVAFKKVADEGSELSDMAVQTGVSVGKLVVMQEALRRAGAPISDTSRMLSMLASNLKEAKFEAGPAREALDDLGISLSEISDKPLDEQFMMILERIRDAGDQVKNLEGAMEGLFGARMGFGILRLAKDLDVNMEKAEKSAKSYAEFMEESSGSLDATADELGRIGMILKATIGKLLINLPWDKINNFLAELHDIDFSNIFGSDFFSKQTPVERGGTLNTEPTSKFARTINAIKSFFKDLFNLEKWKEWGTAVGTAIGEAIKNSLGDFGKLFGGGFSLPKIPGLTSSQTPGNDLLNETKSTNRLLESIMLREGATFA
jgi:hypothetical protein